MKANEAPEKIYISANSQDGTYYISNQYKRLIEYARTDAFIEKACKWLRENINNYTVMSVYDEVTEIKPRLINDFKKAMTL